MSKTECPEVKAKVTERVAELMMKLSRLHLADYGALCSRHDFTQRQLLSCLVLKAYLKTTYRGVIEVLQISEHVRRCLGLEKNCRILRPYKSQRAQPSGDDRANHHRAGGQLGVATVAEPGGGDGSNGLGHHDRECLFSEPLRQAVSTLGESFGGSDLRQPVVDGVGAGLGSEQRSGAGTRMVATGAGGWAGGTTLRRCRL